MILDKFNLKGKAGIVTGARGVAQLTKAMANDWAKYNIKVNAIGLGYYITHATQPLRKNKARYQEISSRIPLGRWGNPEDLGGVTFFLVSENSDYITGQTIFVDGGWQEGGGLDSLGK